MDPVLLWSGFAFLEFSEYGFLLVPHPVPLLITLIVVSDKVKHAVDHQAVQLLFDGVPEFLCLSQRAGIGDHDISQMGGK